MPEDVLARPCTRADVWTEGEKLAPNLRVSGLPSWTHQNACSRGGAPAGRADAPETPVDWGDGLAAGNAAFSIELFIGHLIIRTLQREIQTC